MYKEPVINFLKSYTRIERSMAIEYAYQKISIFLHSSTFKVKKYIRDMYLYVLGLKKSPITRRANSHKKPIKLYWWHAAEHGITNFGDEVSKDIIKTLFGYESEFAAIDECDLMCTGSIIEIAQRESRENNIYVWGSGFIKKESHLGTLDNLRFCAVRGELTKKRIGLPDVTVGDPGLLVNLIYRPSLVVSNKIGVVVHYIDKDLPIVLKIKNDTRFRVIDPLDKPENVAKYITECKMILSSSLHGLIFSDSYGVPNIHIKLSDNVTGGAYKFQDYYSATNRTYSSADINKIFDEVYLEKLFLSYEKVNKLQQIQRRLVKAFPSL